jgi:hypothetical protein
VGLINTTTVGAAAYTDCYLDHPCEPVAGGGAGRDDTSYLTPVIRIDRCFDETGRFALGREDCSLDPGQQVRVIPTRLGAVNPLLATTPLGPVRTRWDVTVSGPFAFYRYKVVAVVGSSACRDLRGYGAPRRASDRPLIDDLLPQQEGFYDLCVLGGSDSRWGATWQPIDFPTVVGVLIDRTPPRIEAGVRIVEEDLSWRVFFETVPPEIASHTFKYGRPSEVRCEDPSGYRLALIPFFPLPKGERPYVFCAIPYDSASNPGKVFEMFLP